MSLLQPRTIQQLQNQLKVQTQGALQKNFASLATDYPLMFNLIWNHPTLTPQQALDAFGTDAASLFLIHDVIKQTINAIAPGTINLTIPYAYEVQQDGTVVVGAKL